MYQRLTSNPYGNAKLNSDSEEDSSISKEFPRKNDNKHLDSKKQNVNRASVEEVKKIKYDALNEDLNSQIKRDLKFTAAQSDTEKINLLYEEMQSMNKALYNIQKMLIHFL